MCYDNITKIKEKIMATSYNEQLEHFQKKYHLPKYDLNSVAEVSAKLRFADGFLMNGPVDNDPATQYLRWLSKTTDILSAITRI